MSARTGRSIIRMMWSVLRRRWAGVLVVLLLIPVGAVLELVHPFILKRVVDDHLKVGAGEGLGALAVMYVLAFIFSSGLSSDVQVTNAPMQEKPFDSDPTTSTSCSEPSAS